MLVYSVPAFFGDELVYGRPGLIFISILFHSIAYQGSMNTPIYLAGVIGATIAWRHGPVAIRAPALFVVIVSLLLLGAGLTLTFLIKNYRGPSILYFEWFLWPFYFIFTVWVFVEAAKRLIPRLVLEVGKGHTFRAHVHFLLPALIPPIAGIALASFNERSPRTNLELHFPPAPTAFTAYLQKEIGITPGEPYRGAVATFAGYGSSASRASWPAMNQFDASLLLSTGNEHRSFGLWWFGIPTLFEYNQYMTPAYYYMMTREFARRQDEQQRSVIVLSAPKPRLLRLLGIRYVIADQHLQHSDEFELVHEMRWERSQQLLATPGNNSASNETLFLYEIRGSSVVHFSPTEPAIVSSALASLEIIARPDFNPQRQVVLQQPISDNLSRAENVRINWERAGMRVRADSKGDALIVLPLQYSRCLELSSDAARSGAKLLRANFLQTGLLLSGSADAMVRFRFGPFTNSTCRLRDYFEMRDMSLGH